MVGTFLANAAGRKVYAQGSHAPHRGRLNPRGFVKREMRRKLKRRQQMRMKKHQRRSGLAKKALMRRRAAQNKLRAKRPPRPRDPRITRKPRPRTAPRPPTGGSGPIDPNGPGGSTGVIRPPTPVKTPGTAPGAPTGGSGAFDPNGPGGTTAPVRDSTGALQTPTTPGNQPANPYIEINSNGQLDLPYNANYSWDVLDSTQEMNKSLIELQQGQQAQASQYQSAGRDLDQQYGDIQHDVLNQDAGRGTAYSSLHGVNVGRNATEYNNARSDLDVQNNQSQQNFMSSRMQIQNAFNDMLRQSGLQNAEGQAANAGTLGYGKGTAKPAPVPRYHPKRARPRPKPKGKGMLKKRMRAKQAKSVKKAGKYYRSHGSFKGFKGPMKAKVIARKRAAHRKIRKNTR